MRRFVATDTPEVASWYAARQLPAPSADMLSEFGLIEPGVAAGWLYRTDSSFALLDGYISNPSAAREARDAALDEITEALIAAARRCGHRRVVAYSAHAAIERLALRQGFRLVGTRLAVERVL